MNNQDWLHDFLRHFRFSCDPDDFAAAVAFLLTKCEDDTGRTLVDVVRDELDTSVGRMIDLAKADMLPQVLLDDQWERSREQRCELVKRWIVMFWSRAAEDREGD